VQTALSCRIVLTQDASNAIRLIPCIGGAYHWPSVVMQVMKFGKDSNLSAQTRVCLHQVRAASFTYTL
jgi:hypothetical protein